MKKQIFTMLLLVIAGVVHAQWSLSGNTLSDDSKLGSVNSKPIRFFTNSIENMRLTEAGNLGLGTNLPGAKLHVTSASNQVAIFNGAPGMYMSLNEGGVSRGYLGSFAGASSDVDFGTAAGNQQGKLHLTIQASPKLTIDPVGNVGIGTTIPTAKLQINHISNGSNPQLLLNDNSTGYARLNFSNTASANVFTIGAMPAVSNSAARFVVYYSGMGDIMSLQGDGRVAIGTAPATGYKLSVQGKVICEEVRVALRATWPDYVFSTNYKLMKVHELEKYIRENKHLPGIAPAGQMKKNGLALGDMQTLMMQKIEELTLYVIDLKKENNQLKKMFKAAIKN